MREWLFPKACYACGAPLLPGEKEACLSCLLRLPKTDFWEQPADNEGFLRLSPHVRGLRGVIAGFWYVVGSPLRAWVHAAKYASQPQLLRAAARYMATLAQSALPLTHIQALLPVPISPIRQRRRGYNQAEWAARGLAEVWGIPVLTDRWVRRPSTGSQLMRGRIARWQALEGEFHCVKPVPAVVGVVDDVLTTGATLSAALKTLPPSTEIWVFTIGITQRRR